MATNFYGSKKMKISIFACIVAASCAGCVPVLVGGMIYKSVKSNEEKSSFTTAFQRTNLEREKAGLKPLDWCSEAYRFDKGWAAENQACEARIRAFEAGDKSAIQQ